MKIKALLFSISLMVVYINGISQDCHCDHIIPQEHLIDGEELGYKPGDTLCLDASYDYGVMHWTNFKGQEGKPITIINCGGKVKIDPPAPDRSFIIKLTFSKYVHITGTGDPNNYYGIELTGLLNNEVNANHGIQAIILTTNIEIDHIEIHDLNFSGIMAKSDPSCNYPTNRGEFIMYDVNIHHNHIYNTQGEGMYIGNSFYASGWETECGLKFPHPIYGCKIHHNIVERTGWDGIQVGAATKGAEIHHNTVKNTGLRGNYRHGNGIQIGEGTGGLCYNNYVENSITSGIHVLGLGDNIIFNNILVNPGRYGSFIDNRPPAIEGTGFKYFNNTIINPEYDCIRIYAEGMKKNIIKNNLLINPGLFEEYESDGTWKSGDDAYIRRNSGKQDNIDASNNFKSRSIDSVKFTSTMGIKYGLSENSPAIDKGADLREFGVYNDYFNLSRSNGKYDIGAVEFRKYYVLGVNDPDVLKYKAFPNPIKSGESLFIQLMNNNMTITDIDLYDVSGRVLKNNITIERESDKYKFSFAKDLSKGYYLIKFTTNDGKKQSFQLVVD